MDSMRLAQVSNQWRALVNTAVQLRDPQKAGNFLTSWGPVSCSGRTLQNGVRWILNAPYNIELHMKCIISAFINLSARNRASN